jgi:SAM-dependent methyltransferase
MTSAQHVDLAPLSDPLLLSIRDGFERHYAEHFPGEKQGLYNDADWRRLEFAAGLIPAGAQAVLEVGVGPGPFLNYLTMTRRHPTVVGIDIRRYSKFLQLAPALDFRIMNVQKLDFPDRHFDVTFCMEVLEHVPPDVMLRGLKELRRVTRSKLIMSVPFEEPLPLPSYHLQRFDMDRVGEVFPDAEMTLLHRPRRKGWPWAIMVETPGRGLRA